MSGMLPGVEVARRRRASHHNVNPPKPSSRLTDRSGYLPSGSGAGGGSRLDETTLRARRSLEEKLRGFDPSRPKCNWSRIFSWGDRSTSGLVSAASRMEPETMGSAANRENLIGAVELDRVGSNRDVCSVCLDGFQMHQTVMNLPCFHRYHSECLRPWLNAHSECPYCRTHISAVVC